MAVTESTLVEIPEDNGIHIKTAGEKGEKYVYKYVKYFRNSEGQPRSRAKVIGKYDADTGRMYPNSYYFELYHLDKSLPDISVWDYGYAYLVTKVCKDMGLQKCLTSAFGANQAMDIIVMAAFMIREGVAMDGIDD